MSDLSEIKSLIDAQGRAFEDFKTTHDALIKAKAEGKAVGDLQAKVDRIDAALSEQSELKAKFDALQAQMNRPNLGKDADAGDAEAELKSFNDMRRSFRVQGSDRSDVTAEDYATYKQAFWEYQRKGSVDFLEPAQRKAMSVGTDADGGYVVPAPTVGRIVQKVYDLSPIRQISNVVSISGDALEGINDLDEASCGWSQETGTRSETNTPQVGRYRIEAHELYALPKVTQKLLDDAAVDIEAWLAAKISDKFARTEGAAFCTGTGVGQPRGFTTYTTVATSTGASWGQMEHVNTGANGDFAASTPADVFFDLIGSFKQPYLNNARFVTRREVIAKIRKFKESTTNAYMWQPGLQVGQPDRLLGYPLVMAQDMPTLATGSLSLAFGDFREGYQIVDRIGMRTLRDPYTARPYIVFYTTSRVGAGVTNYEAIRFLRFSAS